jgi:hypothetical protein
MFSPLIHWSKFSGHSPTSKFLKLHGADLHLSWETKSKIGSAKMFGAWETEPEIENLSHFEVYQPNISKDWSNTPPPPPKVIYYGPRITFCRPQLKIFCGLQTQQTIVERLCHGNTWRLICVSEQKTYHLRDIISAGLPETQELGQGSSQVLKCIHQSRDRRPR